MAKYVKANPLVAQFLGLENTRNRLADGNYILWQADLLAFGPLIHMAESAKQIGALLLEPREARQEQDGEVVRSLPVAEDPRFIMPEEVDEVVEEIAEEVAEEITEEIAREAEPEPLEEAGE